MKRARYQLPRKYTLYTNMGYLATAERPVAGAISVEWDQLLQAIREMRYYYHNDYIQVKEAPENIYTRNPHTRAIYSQRHAK